MKLRKATEAKVKAAQENIKKKASAAILSIGANCAQYERRRNAF